MISGLPLIADIAARLMSTPPRERRHRGLAGCRVALLRLASLCQPCIPKDRKERCASAVGKRVGSRLTIMNYEALDRHCLHRMRGDADGDVADASRGAKQDHTLLCRVLSSPFVPSLLLPPTLGERRHRRLACRFVAVRRRAVFVMAEGERAYRPLNLARYNVSCRDFLLIILRETDIHATAISVALRMEAWQTPIKGSYRFELRRVVRSAFGKLDTA
jgi:hypothetical protein